jgi:hypothetical protein
VDTEQAAMAIKRSKKEYVYEAWECDHHHYRQLLIVWCTAQLTGSCTTVATVYTDRPFKYDAVY